MAKGTNSILIDMDALVDYPLSYMNMLIGTKQHAASYENFSPGFVKGYDLYTLKFYRLYAPTKISRYVMHPGLWDDESADKVFNQLLDRDHDDIFSYDYKYLITTSVDRLIKGYIKAGNGAIKVTIHPKYNSILELDWIKSTYGNIDIVTSNPEDIDMSKYGRLLVGDYKSALKYNIEGQPKSIVVMNYRDNFDLHNITLLNPELIINLGDIHDIRVMDAYNLKNGGDQYESN